MVKNDIKEFNELITKIEVNSRQLNGLTNFRSDPHLGFNLNDKSLIIHYFPEDYTKDILFIGISSLNLGNLIDNLNNLKILINVNDRILTGYLDNGELALYEHVNDEGIITDYPVTLKEFKGLLNIVINKLYKKGFQFKVDHALNLYQF